MSGWLMGWLSASVRRRSHGRLSESSPEWGRADDAGSPLSESCQQAASASDSHGDSNESPSSSHPSAESAREGMKYSQDGGLFPSHINYRTSWLCEMRPWEASNPSIK
ncbi:hypothetical protein H112_07615 [Trichophyton rubrum D6]|uniref:Uncharacterized protein n=1 Tax=Trichophyton rubrum CBS 288.86 TaxID=1215330 RepID=A0A022VR96_TRIRU|nr:hypothetical protein H103_07628 [Trichophyton rubrum CBS 288.86]EZF80729.1 hypothetical protein H110_07625 [Trichophyton rubrum MR1448]KDB29880.1 hypothetical protein H112_07615 [Trichophyton rubrum D6]